MDKLIAMTVEQHDVIDFATLQPPDGFVLSISDHLLWDNVNFHLFTLQAKVNAYLRFIKSGEIEEKFPNSTGQTITIDVVLKFSPPIEAEWFFTRVSSAVNDAGFQFRYRILPLN